MSLEAVRPFFRARLNSLGFKEHSDAFDDDNRPQTKLDKLYRLESGPITGTPANQQTHEFDYDISIVISLKGKGDKNIELRDRADSIAGTVLEDILNAEVRNGTDIKDIVPGAITFTPISASDDNDLLMTMDFTCTILCEF